MSLFDVLRYPISDHPTKEEFEALPKDLFEQWTNAVYWHSDYANPKCLETAYSDKGYAPFLKDLLVLRNMIKDYDEPI